MISVSRHHPAAAPAAMACFDPTAMIIASAAASALGTIQQGRAQARAAQAQADTYRQQVAFEAERSALAESELRREQSARAARLRALQARSGIDPSAGSALLTAASAAVDDDLDMLMMRANGIERADRLARAASYYDARGRDARTAGVIGLGSTILSTGRHVDIGGGGMQGTPNLF
ncbi:MAG: hypothetical protein U1E97_02705 [Alphaproteobacteria bacterium]